MTESHLKSKQVGIKLLILYSVKIADFAYFLQVRNITVYNILTHCERAHFVIKYLLATSYSNAFYC